MKTIFDAVNELRADLNNSEDYEGGEESLYYSKNKGEIYTYYGNTLNNNYGYHICTIIEFNALVAEMETNFGKCCVDDVIAYRRATKELLKPELNIYTQDMYDNGELPSVGMRVIFKHGGYYINGGVVAITNEFIVITEDSGKERIRKVSEALLTIKPIATPTTLIDGEAYQFNFEGGVPTKGIYYDGDFTNHIGAYEADECANIKPLTVKGE